MKKILTILFLNIIHLKNTFASIEDSILPKDTTIAGTAKNIDGKSVVVDSLAYVKDTTFSLLAMIAIAVFLYLGYKLIVARGNEEDFKKALLSFVYAVVGIVLVSLSWALVSFVSGIQF